MLQTLTITSPAAMPGSWLTEIARDAHHRRAATEWSASAAWGTCTRQCPEAVFSTGLSVPEASNISGISSEHPLSAWTQSLTGCRRGSR